MSLKKYNIVLIFSLYSVLVFPQKQALKTGKETLIELGRTITEAGSDSVKIVQNVKFSNELLKLLNQKKSYKLNFEDIKQLKVLQPKNRKFKIFTWFLDYKDGTYEYFGIIQQCKKNGKKCKIYQLNTVKNQEKTLENQNLQYSQWYGCIYYDIIPIEINKTTYYTLLGWDGNNNYTTKKIIDILKISKKEAPSFGADLFNNQQQRVIIEYSSKYSISLQYDDNLEYIVFDHLEPIDGLSTGNFQLYAPNLSYDIFKKTNTGWKLEQNLYLNNQK